MFEILKLNLQGFSAYKIARKLNIDPPTVYASLKAAKKNFVVAEEMLKELHALGWQQKPADIEKQLQETSVAVAASAKEEIAIKIG